eukprot:120910_1
MQAQFLKILLQNAEEDNAFTNDDAQVCNDIKIRICHVFNLSPKSPHNANMDLIIFSHAQHWIENNILSITSELINLQSKYGKGALIMMTKSPEHFAQNRYMVPLGMQNMISIFNLNDCILQHGLFFANKTLLSLLNIDYNYHMQIVKNQCKKQNQSHNSTFVNLMIYNNDPRWLHNVSYPFSIKTYEQTLIEFFRKNKFKRKTLRKIDSRLIPLFTETNEIFLRILMSKAYNITTDKTLTGLLFIIIPKELVNYIDDEKQKEIVQNIIDNVYIEAERNESKFEQFILNVDHIPYMRSFKGQVKHLELTLGQFPFMLTAALKLGNICGTEMYQKTITKIWKSNPNTNTLWEKCNELGDFIEKIEGKKCSFCSKQETNKKHRICSVCKKRWYCGKQCQKKDWNKTHRNECKKQQFLICNKMKRFCA